MNKSPKQYPIRYFNLTIDGFKSKPRISRSKRYNYQRSLDVSLKSQDKKSQNDLKILITSLKSSNQPASRPAKKRLKQVDTHCGSKSIIQVNDLLLNTVPKSIIINSVLKDIPLRLNRRPFSAISSQSRKKEDSESNSRCNIRKSSNNSQMSVVDEFFEKKTRNFGSNINT